MCLEQQIVEFTWPVSIHEAPLILLLMADEIHAIHEYALPLTRQQQLSIFKHFRSKQHVVVTPKAPTIIPQSSKPENGGEYQSQYTEDCDALLHGLQ